ncbi:hypothetical protein MCOR04_009670 [Pyricularia oryzae]|uniref:Uncharacterized protein n=1 Tax=Pyricularia oryzae TaxID=318829 RepID=A0A4P7NEA3_PYROR|nr:hypothetical protein MCOR13_011013 [Pyricularia oryzae]KAI6560567.1 hypothetical protein MCOR04_009670 [Pyricularia oryzae]KAI6604467.1 hypothetical protein MCOR12_002340 [Pyricularia oryzae]QBZ60169.1 hypothetical protein PoMZ_07107 [Pyricularia oryzae]
MLHNGYGRRAVPKNPPRSTGFSFILACQNVLPGKDPVPAREMELKHRRASGAARHLAFGTNNLEKWIGSNHPKMRWVGAYAVGTVRISPGESGSATYAGHHA